MKSRLSAILLALSLFALPVSGQAAPAKYTFDKEHTIVLFYINHLGFTDKIGKFRDYDGDFVFDEEKPEASSVTISFNPKGIETDSDKLDSELQGEKWFNTAKFPTATFKSTKVTLTGKNTADVTGWFTLLGKEKPLTLKVTFNKAGKFPIGDRYAAGFSLDTKFKRSEFGLDNYVPMVGDEVRIHAEVEGTRVEEPAAKPAAK